MKKKPFIKLFSNSNRFFCYDINSNNIMEIDKPLFDFLSLSEERFFELISKLLIRESRVSIKTSMNIVIPWQRLIRSTKKKVGSQEIIQSISSFRFHSQDMMQYCETA